ncbi:hypothetical protein TRV_05016 [Trichophyton verrucosum HKI 0517]|uniref:Uncharacterized protein n=1 Tax=Trichophyton verrucosum (strain HKI 0517) TaxID=663202 RepID=D4DD10_TRIVH|nr:uncharacterized protein TRV_05016 [Trichophyton verrucosum HKI 0517]EFE40260.1 hypothetical protein TRV_05016 [Trichophyton verrucosum HKI 0517]
MGAKQKPGLSTVLKQQKKKKTRDKDQTARDSPLSLSYQSFPLSSGRQKRADGVPGRASGESSALLLPDRKEKKRDEKREEEEKKKKEKNKVTALTMFPGVYKYTD